MAEGLTTAEGAAPVADPLKPEPRPTPAAARPHRGRFLFIYGILAVALAAGIAGIVVYAGRAINPAPAWSAWRPHGGGLGAAKQIAEHVSATYRLPSGQQLVDVIAKPPSVSPSNQVIPIHFFAVRGQHRAEDRFYQVSSNDSLMYSLCGLGTSCSISSGKPSVERGTLVRREILELALYTFKYVQGVQRVVAFMPPPPGSQPSLAVFLQKSDLANELKLPLQRTLGSKVPLPKTITAREQQKIDETTQARVYSVSLSQSQATGDVILVLKPLAA